MPLFVAVAGLVLVVAALRASADGALRWLLAGLGLVFVLAAGAMVAGLRRGDAGPLRTTPTAQAGPAEVTTNEAGDIIFKMLRTDSMAAHTLEAAGPDVSLAADAALRAGPDPSVTCLAVRSSGELPLPARAYLFCVSPAMRQWAFARRANGVSVDLQGFTPSPFIEPDANRLEVRARGDTFDLLVNGNVVGTQQDDTFADGVPQLVCGTPRDVHGRRALCVFRNVEVTTPE
jgi:hypothetical protein